MSGRAAESLIVNRMLIEAALCGSEQIVYRE
jgi:hypothetical protein